MEQREYLFALWEELGLKRDVVLVLHDWGSTLEFDWACNTPIVYRALPPRSPRGRSKRLITQSRHFLHKFSRVTVLQQHPTRNLLHRMDASWEDLPQRRGREEVGREPDAFQIYFALTSSHRVPTPVAAARLLR